MNDREERDAPRARETTGRAGIGFVEAFAMMTLIAGSGAYLLWTLIDQRLTALDASQPRIAVVDYAPVTDALKAGRPLEEIAPMFEAVRAEGARYAEAGYLVVTTAQIVAAPATMRVAVDLAPAPATGTLSAPGLPLDFRGVVQGLTGARGGGQ